MNSAPQLVAPDHPALWERAHELTDADRLTHQTTIDLMRDAVSRVNAAGLAAPQLGLGLRLFVSSNATFPVVINPSWRQVGADFISKPERCVTRIDFSTFVRRPAKIHAQWLDRDGFIKTAILESMDARIFLHLYDLIDGTPIFSRPHREKVSVPSACCE